MEQHSKQSSSKPAKKLASVCTSTRLGVERWRRTIREELYYSRDDLPPTVSDLRDYVRRDDYSCNWLRPHQALDDQLPVPNVVSDLCSFDVPLSYILDAFSSLRTPLGSHALNQHNELSEGRSSGRMIQRGESL